MAAADEHEGSDQSSWRGDSRIFNTPGAVMK
jgi:hypothetical protein